MNKLLIRNLPVEFSDNDKRDFLKLFGASEVTTFPVNGKMRSCCFVSFPDSATAKQGLDTLHQFEILGQRLVAEYAKPPHTELANKLESKAVLDRKVFVTDQTKSNKKDQKEEEREEIISGINPKLNVNHEFPSHLMYKYPDPNIVILTNIANALATVPKFYTQVLHLMNKMNLPPPFSGSSQTPPLPGDSVTLRDACVDTSDLNEFLSSDESELESDTETKIHEIYKDNTTVIEPMKKRKRLRALGRVEQEKLNVVPKPKNAETVASAFECTTSSRRFEFKLAASIQEAVERKSQPAISYNVFDERGEFGKIMPMNKDLLEIDDEEEDDDDDEEEENQEYISAVKLKENRISSKEILSMAQFKNYAIGDKTNRLYIKNLAKAATEDNLNFIYKRFVRKCTDDEKSSLEIRLMKEGRMKGQAFVTFPTEEIAEEALKSTHGYILYEKPMVVQYGRAGKAK